MKSEPVSSARLSSSMQRSGSSKGLGRARTLCGAGAAVLPLFSDENYNSRDEDDQAQPIGNER